jgi:hypothetical protein
MKRLFTLLFVLVCLGAFAQQPDRSSLNLSLMVFDRALEKKDSISLNRLLSKDVSYGHSNGWVENKSELIADLYNGKIDYDRVVTSNPEVAISGNVARVTSTAEVYAKLDGSEQQYYKLKVMQVWLWEKGHWVLFARQSAPLKA